MSTALRDPFARLMGTAHSIPRTRYRAPDTAHSGKQVGRAHVRCRTRYAEVVSTPEAVLTTATVVVFGVTGGTKLLGWPGQLAEAERLGLSARVYRLVGVLELLGALGVLLGLLVWTTVGVFACIGLLLLMLAAIAFHVHAHDNITRLAPAGWSGLLAIAGLVALVVES